jgi:adenylate cyclase
MPSSVAVTHDTWARIKDRFEGESLGELEIKGILRENAPSRGG